MADDFQKWVGGVDVKLDTIIDGIKSHESRLSSLETDRDRAKGALWGVGAIAGVIGAFVHKIIGLVN